MEELASAPCTPAGVVADAGAALTGLGEVLWAARSAEELVDTVAELEALRCRLAAVWPLPRHPPPRGSCRAS